MFRALYTAASGMLAQQLNLDNIANNLANASTTGYKMRRAQFQDLMYQSMVQPGSAAGQQTVVPTGLQLGLGTRASSNESSLPRDLSRKPTTPWIWSSRVAGFSRCASLPAIWPTPVPARSTSIRMGTS